VPEACPSRRLISSTDPHLMFCKPESPNLLEFQTACASGTSRPVPSCYDERLGRRLGQSFFVQGCGRQFREGGAPGWGLMPAHRVSGLPTAPKSSHYLYLFIGLWKHELYTFENSSGLDGYCSFAYSALACFRMGMSGAASFQSVRKSL
jgi:hypothetical protein